MDDAFERYTDRVTLCDDGVYRWYYDMDMYKNKSMLWMLLRINLFIMLGASLGARLLLRRTRLLRLAQDLRLLVLLAHLADLAQVDVERDDDQDVAGN